MPNKLAEAKIVTTKVAESATFVALLPGQVVHSKFGWGELQVIPQRFQITTTTAPYVRICDFALKALRDLAPTSAVTAFGINNETHFDLGSVDAANKLGTRLAPPTAWGAWGAEIASNMQGENKGTPLQGGLLYIQMRQPFIESEISGWLDVSVGASNVIPNRRGALFRSNHHHQMPNSGTDSLPASDELTEREITNLLLDRLADTFDSSIVQAESIFKGMIAS